MLLCRFTQICSSGLPSALGPELRHEKLWYMLTLIFLCILLSSNIYKYFVFIELCKYPFIMQTKIKPFKEVL